MGNSGAQIVEYLLSLTNTDVDLEDESGNKAIVYAKSIAPGSPIERALSLA
jgi:hypothetical protein